MEQAAIRNISQLLKSNGVKVSKKEIRDQLEILKQDYPNLQISNSKVTVTTDKVILEGINFGKFRVSILTKSRKTLFPGEIFSFEALTPNYPVESFYRSFYHPHLYGNTGCFSKRFNEVIYRLGKNGDLIGLVDSAVSFVHNCNPSHSPFPLELWEQVLPKCKDCGMQLSFYQAINSACTECFEPICGYCVRYCQSCKNRICPDCTSSLEGKVFCSECAETIEGKAR